MSPLTTNDFSLPAVACRRGATRERIDDHVNLQSSALAKPFQAANNGNFPKLLQPD